MKSIWCWRCKADIPMLDEDEFQACFDGETLDKPGWRERILRRYQSITGFAETNINAIYHHRLRLYGPPCPLCGKPLRTPQARFCAACGFRA